MQEGGIEYELIVANQRRQGIAVIGIQATA